MKKITYYCDICGEELNKNSHISVQFLDVESNEILSFDYDKKFTWIFRFLFSNKLRKIFNEEVEFDIVDFTINQDMMIVRAFIHNPPKNLPKNVIHSRDNYYLVEIKEGDDDE